MREGVDRINKHHDDQERQAIKEWLTPVNYFTQQSDFIDRRQEGTGKWLLDSAEFQGWLEASKQTLFCPGIPGAGKTMITSIIVEHLSAKFQSDAHVGIAYLYCSFRRHQEQRPVDLLTSLLKQLVQGRPSIPTSVKNLYECHKEKQTRPSCDEVSKVLDSVVAEFTQTFIIVDALDECQILEGSCEKFLSGIFNLQAKTGANLFATSRFIPEIVKQFEGSVSLEICASDEDVKRYLDGHMFELPSFVRRSSELQEEIKTSIVKAVDGMYVPIHSIGRLM
jgi:Cdc6-like AAA superfamily ATPase